MNTNKELNFDVYLITEYGLPVLFYMFNPNVSLNLAQSFMFIKCKLGF